MAVSGTSWDRSANGRPLGRAPRRALQFGPHPVALILPGAPVVTVNSAAALIGRTYPAANNAVSQLTDAGVLKQVNLGRRNRAYEAGDIITAFTDLERQLASPEGDTRTSEPVRRVPRRR